MRLFRKLRRWFQLRSVSTCVMCGLKAGQTYWTADAMADLIIHPHRCEACRAVIWVHGFAFLCTQCEKD